MFGNGSSFVSESEHLISQAVDDFVSVVFNAFLNKLVLYINMFSLSVML